MKVLRLIQAAAKHRVPTTLDVGVSITVSRTAESRDAGDAVWDLQVRTTHADVSLRRWLISSAGCCSLAGEVVTGGGKPPAS